MPTRSTSTASIRGCADARARPQLIDTPRHLSQHPGGFVLTRDRLDELVPIEPAAMVDRQRDRMGQGRHRGARSS
jgi:hypothetical protein